MALTLLAANNASTLLVSGISAASTTLQVSTGTGDLFPSPVPGTSYFKVTLTSLAAGKTKEIVHVTARSGDTLTIARGQEGTTAASWDSGASVANLFTAGTFSELAQQKDVTQVYTDLASTATGKGTDLVFTKSLLAGSVARSQHDKNSDFRTLEDFGAIGDGTNHPLSERFSTLTAAQMVYSFVTSLTQSIDWAAAKAASLTGGFKLLNKVYSLSDTLVINGAISITGCGQGISRLLFTGSGNGIEINLSNNKDSKFNLRGFTIERNGVPSSAAKETGLKINGAAQIIIPGTSTTLATLGYRTECRGTVEDIRICGTNQDANGWFRGFHFNSLMNFKVTNISFCGYVTGDWIGEAITVSGNGYCTDFSFSRVWVFFCDIAFNFPDYVEGFHLSDFEFVNVNIGIKGGVVQPDTVVPKISGSINSPGMLSSWIGDGHISTKQHCILMPYNFNHAKIRNLELFCQPRSTDTQGRSAVLCSYADNISISDVFILMDAALNNSYLDDNSGVLFGGVTQGYIDNVRVYGIANRGSAVLLTTGSSDCRVGNIDTNCKYGIAETGGVNINNVLGPVMHGFGTARFNFPTNFVNNSFVYDAVYRSYTMSVTGTGGAATNYFDITPTAPLSEKPQYVSVSMGGTNNSSVRVYYDYDNSSASVIRIRADVPSLNGTASFRVFVSYNLV